MKYYFTYVLQLEDRSGKAAVKGSCAHKILELLAQSALKTPMPYDDDTLGILDSFDLDYISRKSINWYGDNNQHLKWEKADIRDIEKSVQIVLDSTYSPLKMNIFRSEQFFDIEMEGPEFAYSFDYGGEKIAGQLRLRGTIDLIAKLDDSTLELTDWKTGKRLNWASGKEKDTACLTDDQQLKLYYYVIKKFYPEYKNLMVTIYYINDGGPYTLCFDPSSVPDIEEDIKTFFTKVKDDWSPEKTSNPLPCKFCNFSKTNWEDGGQSKCDFLAQELHEIGMTRQIKLRGSPKKIFNYSGGGKTINVKPE